MGKKKSTHSVFTSGAHTINWLYFRDKEKPGLWGGALLKPQQPTGARIQPLQPDPQAKQPF